MLPNTALGTGGKKVSLPHIPQPLSRTYMQQQIQRNGLIGSNPPSYALKNKDTFDAWVRRAVEWIRVHSGQQVAVKTPTGTKVTTSQPIATNRNLVIR